MTMATAKTHAFDLVNDEFRHPFLSDSAMAEELQFQEAVMASSLTCQMPTSDEKETGESCLVLCDICKKKKEYGKIIKNGECDHSFCLDCVDKYLEEKIKEGIKIVPCPGLSCECDLALDAFKQFLANDCVPDSCCSKNTEDGSGNLVKAVYGDISENPSPDEKTGQFSRLNLPGKSANGKPQYRSNYRSRLSRSRGNERHKSAYNCSRNKQPIQGSSSCKRPVADEMEKNVGEAGIASVKPGEKSGKWKGLKDEKKDYLIVWPPMVVIRNTSVEKDANNKWIGMTTQELLDMFSLYDGIERVQHSYNWQQGHCGVSILIFESSARGYLEAERLHKHFLEEGIHRNAWNHRPNYFLPTGERQLYGYMALKEDVDYFNKHYSKGSPKLRYELRSHQETVVNRIRQMGEDNYRLLSLTNRVAEQQGHAKDLEESSALLKEKLQKAAKELDILRRRANQHHEMSVEELEFQEKFYEDQIKTITEARTKQEQDQEEVKPKSGNENPLSTNKHKPREMEAEVPSSVRKNQKTDGAAKTNEYFQKPQMGSAEGKSTSYFDKSWGEIAIPIIGAAIPIIWRIIR